MNEQIFVLSSQVRRTLKGSGLRIVAMMAAVMCSTLSQADTTNRSIIACRSPDFVRDIINASSSNDEGAIDYLFSRKLCEGFKAGLQYEVVSIADDGMLSVNFLVPTTNVTIRLYSTRALER